MPSTLSITKNVQNLQKGLCPDGRQSLTKVRESVVVEFHGYFRVGKPGRYTKDQAHMKKRGRGSILHIASVRDYACQRGEAGYAASKGAIYSVHGGPLPSIGVQ
jgi:hypothetical protein